jgi:hypothetical protein
MPGLASGSAHPCRTPSDRRAWTLTVALWTAVASTASTGCGARSGVDVGPPLDAGPTDLGDADLPVDMELPDMGGPLQLLCGMSVRFTAPRRPVTVAVEVAAMLPIVSEFWELSRSPAGSRPTLDTRGREAVLTPDVEGVYALRYTVVDVIDRIASCEVEVRAVVGPPVALCPEGELVTRPDVPVEVRGDGFDDIAVVSYRWDVRVAPSPSRTTLEPPDAPVTRFTADTPGRYQLELTVTDEDGATGTCVARVRVNAPPVVECPPSPVRAPTRRPLMLTARATDDVEVVATRWDLVERPAMSAASLSPTTGTTTRMTPDRVGRYLVRFTATDGDGESASCDIVVEGTPTPPTAICPPTIETTPLTTVTLMGRGEDDGRVVGYRWEAVTLPTGSSAAPPAPATSATTRYTPDIAGDYLLRLTVTDDMGMTGTCETLVRAINQEGLRVELYWNPPDRSCDTRPGPGCDRSDLDLHLLAAEGTQWFDSRWDCHYANCVGGRLEWGAPGPSDNPSLDLDDTEGFGPENINIERPVPATYRVGVHYFADENNRPAQAYVNVYCGAGTTEPVARYGPVELRPGSSSDTNGFWKVADVTVGAGSCRAVALTDAAGRPQVVTTRAARTER